MSKSTISFISNLPDVLKNSIPMIFIKSDYNGNNNYYSDVTGTDLKYWNVESSSLCSQIEKFVVEWNSMNIVKLFDGENNGFDNNMCEKYLKEMLEIYTLIDIFVFKKMVNNQIHEILFFIKQICNFAKKYSNKISIRFIYYAILLVSLKTTNHIFINKIKNEMYYLVSSSLKEYLADYFTEIELTNYANFMSNIDDNILNQNFENRKDISKIVQNTIYLKSQKYYPTNVFELKFLINSLDILNYFDFVDFYTFDFDEKKLDAIYVISQFINTYCIQLCENISKDIIKPIVENIFEINFKRNDLSNYLVKKFLVSLGNFLMSIIKSFIRCDFIDLNEAKIKNEKYKIFFHKKSEKLVRLVHIFFSDKNSIRICDEIKNQDSMNIIKLFSDKTVVFNIISTIVIFINNRASLTFKKLNMLLKNFNNGNLFKNNINDMLYTIEILLERKISEFVYVQSDAVINYILNINPNKRMCEEVNRCDILRMSEYDNYIYSFEDKLSDSKKYCTESAYSDDDDFYSDDNEYDNYSDKSAYDNKQKIIDDFNTVCGMLLTTRKFKVDKNVFNEFFKAFVLKKYYKNYTDMKLFLAYVLKKYRHSNFLYKNGIMLEEAFTLSCIQNNINMSYDELINKIVSKEYTDLPQFMLDFIVNILSRMNNVVINFITFVVNDDKVEKYLCKTDNTSKPNKTEIYIGCLYKIPNLFFVIDKTDLFYLVDENISYDKIDDNISPNTLVTQLYTSDYLQSDLYMLTKNGVKIINSKVIEL